MWFEVQIPPESLVGSACPCMGSPRGIVVAVGIDLVSRTYKPGPVADSFKQTKKGEKEEKKQILFKVGNLEQLLSVQMCLRGC